MEHYYFYYMNPKTLLVKIFNILNTLLNIFINGSDLTYDQEKISLN